MSTDKLLHFLLLIIIILYFSWLNSMPKYKEEFHPKLKEQYRSGMRNMNSVKKKMEYFKDSVIRNLSKKLGY